MSKVQEVRVPGFSAPTDRGDAIPELHCDQLWLGKAEGQWPIQAFTSADHVIAWLDDAKARHERRHAWRVDMFTLTEVTTTKPVRAQLVDKHPDAP